MTDENSRAHEQHTILDLLKSSDKAFETVVKHYSGQFNYHAAQRLTTFRYFVTAFSIFSAAYATLMAREEAPLALAAAGVAFLAYLLVLCFARLDKRNEQIILINEEPIRVIQREIDGYVGGNGFFSTFDRTDDENCILMTFGSILPLVFLITALASIAGIYLALLSPALSAWQPNACVWLAPMIITVLALYVPTGYRKKKAGHHLPKIHAHR